MRHCDTPSRHRELKDIALAKSFTDGLAINHLTFPAQSQNIMSRIATRRISQILPNTRLRITPTVTASVSIHHKQLHTSRPRCQSKPKNPDPRENPAHDLKPPSDINIGRKRFADFDLAGKTFIVTGGAQGLGLALAEGLVEAGGKGKDHCEI